MELKSLTPQLAAVLRDLGVSYDPKRLAEALKGKQLDVTTRGAQVSSSSTGAAVVALVARAERDVAVCAAGGSYAGRLCVEDS